MVNMVKVVIAVCVLLIIVGWAMLGKKVLRAFIFRSAKTQVSESVWIEMCAGLLVVVVAIAEYVNSLPDATIVMWLGVLVFFAGGLVQLIARKQLCDDQTFEDRLSSGFEAAQTKMYKYLRFPGASALVLLVSGLCLALGSWWGLGLVLVLFFPSVLFKVSQEERTLYDKFGDRWLEYKSDSKRIIPGVF